MGRRIKRPRENELIYHYIYINEKHTTNAHSNVPCNRFQKPKPSNGPILKQFIQAKAAHVVQDAGYGVGFHLLPGPGLPTTFGLTDRLGIQRQTKTIGRHQVGIDVILPGDADRGQCLLEDAATLATEVVQAKEEGILGPGAIYVVWLLDV